MHLLRSPEDKSHETIIMEMCDEVQALALKCLHFNKENDLRLESEEMMADIHQYMLTLKTAYRRLFGSHEYCEPFIKQFYDDFHPETYRTNAPAAKKRSLKKTQHGNDIFHQSIMANYDAVFTTRANAALNFARALNELIPSLAPSRIGLLQETSSR